MLFVNTDTILSFYDIVDQLSITDLNYLKLELNKMLYNKIPLLLSNTSKFYNKNDNITLNTFSLTKQKFNEKNNTLEKINVLSSVKFSKKSIFTALDDEENKIKKIQIETDIIRIVKIEKIIEKQILFEKYIVCKYKTLTMQQFTLIVEELLQRQYIYTQNTKLYYYDD